MKVSYPKIITVDAKDTDTKGKYDYLVAVFAVTGEIKYPHKKTINGVEITEYSEEAYEDDVGGFHDCAEGWNPNGVWCGECCALSCRGCVNENLTKEN